MYIEPKIDSWIAVNTNFQAPQNTADDEYARLRHLLGIARRITLQAAPGSVIVLPESIGGNWEVNSPYWQDIGALARTKEVTLLVGAYQVVDESSKYINGLFGVGDDDQSMIPGRMPVPVSMWIPFSEQSAVASWWHPGATKVHGRVAAHLVCYEQLLIWPVLRSMAEKPDVLIGVANDWWAARTSIPSIQRQVVEAWGRLFAVPIVFAGNE
jgi:apolipoprotein N-acyltransferase